MRRYRLLERSLNIIIKKLSTAFYEQRISGRAGEEDGGGEVVADFAFISVSMISWSKVGRFELPIMRDPAPVMIATSPVKSSARGGAGIVFEFGKGGLQCDGLDAEVKLW
jgi:hypothetical protein